MAKIQANVDREILKEIKKDAIDKDVTLGTYINEALVDRLEKSKLEDKKEENKQTN